MRWPGIQVFSLFLRRAKTIGGFGGKNRFSYNQLYGVPGEVANRVPLEAGRSQRPGTRRQSRATLLPQLVLTGNRCHARSRGRGFFPDAPTSLQTDLHREAVCHFRAEWKSSSETDVLWAPTLGTTVTYFNSHHSQRFSLGQTRSSRPKNAHDNPVYRSLYGSASRISLFATCPRRRLRTSGELQRGISER
jgi:hypothetical protein